MTDRSLPDWAFSAATVPTASSRSRTEFCQASASSRVLETTYLVAAFMCVVTGLPSVKRPRAVMKSCQVRRPNSMSLAWPWRWPSRGPSPPRCTAGPAAVREAAAGVLVRAAEALHTAVEGDPHRDRDRTYG